jgi:hypothetical protein
MMNRLFRKGILPFTPLESPAICGGDNMDKISTPYRKGRVKAPSFLTGLTILVLAISAIAFALDNIAYKTQGKVTEVNLVKKTLVIGETTFFWDENTIFSDAKGSPITINKVKPDAWVYIACEYNRRTDKRIARNVYLLPKHIGKKEQHLYPFME